MYVEKTVCDVDGKLVIYHENLKKLKRKLEIIQQMCDAPKVYVSAVVEVVRRRHFSQHFLRVSDTALLFWKRWKIIVICRVLARI